MRNLSRFSILIVNIQVFLFDYNLWDTKWCILYWMEDVRHTNFVCLPCMSFCSYEQCFFK